MVVNMTHNESVKTFDDIVCHLELEAKRLVVVKPNEQAYVAKSNLAITNHIARDRGAHVEFRQISFGTRWIYVGNNFKVGVDGIGTCKLELYRGCTLFLYDDLHLYEMMDPDIRSTPKQQLMPEPSGSELPKSVQDALTCLTKDEWRKAMEEELESMQKNQVGTWLIYLQIEKLLGTNGF
ncbi:hypothetical protein AAG906_010753 [Vitis piasezkii]